jgi:quercetin dioxygenase-like cupin family protein
MVTNAFKIALGLAVVVMAPWAVADAPHGLERTVVTTGDVAQSGYQAVVARVTLAPGGSSGRHTHPGDEISYVVSGQAELRVDGQPVQTVDADHAFIVSAGKIHELRNTTDKPVVLIGTYVVKKGQPLATPAP